MISYQLYNSDTEQTELIKTMNQSHADAFNDVLRGNKMLARWIPLIECSGCDTPIVNGRCTCQ